MYEVEFYIDRRGTAPAWEFLQSLPKREQAKLVRKLELLEEFGTALREPHAKNVEGKLWELRGGAGRLFYFMVIERTFVILHGYIKKGRKAPQQEIAIALSRMDDRLAR